MPTKDRAWVHPLVTEGTLLPLLALAGDTADEEEEQRQRPKENATNHAADYREPLLLCGEIADERAEQQPEENHVGVP